MKGIRLVKIVLSIVTIFVLVMTMSCARKTSTGAAQTGRPLTAAELENASGDFLYWSSFQGDSMIWENWRVDVFRNLYPNVKVHLQTVPESAGMTNGQLLAAIAGGNPPDVLVADNYVAAYGFAGQGALLPWDPYLEAIGVSFNDFLPGFRDLMQYNGQTYLVPQDSNVIMLYINTDMIREAGLDINNYPKNLVELEQWADRLTLRDASGRITRYGFIPWIDYPGETPVTWPFMFGAEIYNTQTNKLELTDPRVVAAFQWIREWAQKYDPVAIRGFTQTAGGFFSPDHLFFQNRLAMTVTGNWVTNAMRIYAPQVNYTVVPIPVPPGGRVRSTPLGSNVYVIPRGAKRPDLAALFFKFTQRPEINADNFDTWRSIPCVDKYFDDVSWTKNGDPIYALQRELANSPLSGHPALSPVSAELHQAFIALLDDVIFNNRDPLPLLQALQNRLQPEVDRLIAR